MKYYLALLLALAIFWLSLSGHFNGFLLSMGGASCLLVLWFSKRMGIVDDEGVPVQLGLISLASYIPWLIKQIVVSNYSVIRIILSQRPALRRAMFNVAASPLTSVGRLIMANSITLTPGTVTTDVQPGSMQVHALVNPGIDDPTIREIDRRVRILEGR
jgi:multicomponent Na+:H+ antiporter subunit E